MVASVAEKITAHDVEAAARVSENLDGDNL
jgi:hypothetical protein